jgi:predicted O-methyltransferase YrrM
MLNKSIILRSSIIKKIIFPIRKILDKIFAQILKNNANKTTNIEDLVSLTFTVFKNSLFKQWAIEGSQVKEEITHLLQILVKRKPKAALEIGTAQGATLFLFTRVSSPNAVIISLDLPASQRGYANWRVPYYEAFGSNKQQMIMVKMDSHDPVSLELIRQKLNGRLLDFLFIDGDHTYEGVKMDFEMYSPLVREGGLIGFHDICQHRVDSECQVIDFWDEIKRNYKFEEIIKDRNQLWAGIGILYL